MPNVSTWIDHKPYSIKHIAHKNVGLTASHSRGQVCEDLFHLVLSIPELHIPHNSQPHNFIPFYWPDSSSGNCSNAVSISEPAVGETCGRDEVECIQAFPMLKILLRCESN